MDHSAYIRDTGGDTAVLMIHGIVGTPAHFRELIPLIPEEWTVHALLLDGHGGSVAEFSATSMKTWKGQVKAHLDALLAAHSRVLVAAHSMGTLFAIQAALDHPEEIDGLFLLAVPTRPWVRLSTMVTSLRLVLGVERPGDRALAAMAEATSVRLERKLWKYVGWLPRYVELLVEIRRIRRLLPELAVPTMTFQSQRDELVSARSIRDLEGHPWIKNTVLHGSGHFAYGPEDICLLRRRFQALLDGGWRAEG